MSEAIVTNFTGGIVETGIGIGIFYRRHASICFSLGAAALFLQVNVASGDTGVFYAGI
jgi:hypothetical protein